jgi:hypothetical protein
MGQQLLESDYERVLTLYGLHITSKMAAQSLAAGIIHAKVEVLNLIYDVEETTEAGDEPGSYL